MILSASVPGQGAEAAGEEEPLLDATPDDSEQERGPVEPENAEDEDFD